MVAPALTGLSGLSGLVGGGAAAPVGPITYTKQLGSANRNTGGATPTILVITTTGAAAAGATIVVACGSRNATPVTGCTDSAGNTYTIDASVANSTTLRTTICSCRNALALPAGGTITISWAPSTTNMAIGVADEFAGPQAAATDQTATATGTGTAIVTAATGATAQAAELVYGALGVLIDATGAIPTVVAGSGFTRTLEVTTASNAQRVGVYPEYKAVSSVGTQVADGTLSVSKDWAAVVATYRAT